MEFTPAARLLGMYSAAAVVLFELAYAITLAVGLLSLDAPHEPIGDPMFWIMEVLIIGMTPALVALMVAVHAWAPRHLEVLSFAAVVFMGLLAGLTSSVHFVILAVSRQPEFMALPALPLLLSFTWPSVTYALDILAWDVFFPFAMLFAAPVFTGRGLESWLRWSMIASGALAFAGLAGVAAGDMTIRNVGIIGYVPMFMLVSVLLFLLFRRSTARDTMAVR